MDKSFFLKEPTVLEIGTKYKLKVEDTINHRIFYEDVSFSRYTNSSDVIVVETGIGQKIQVFRNKIFKRHEKK